MNAFKRDYYKLMLRHPFEWWHARKRVRNELKFGCGCGYAGCFEDAPEGTRGEDK